MALDNTQHFRHTMSESTCSKRERLCRLEKKPVKKHESYRQLKELFFFSLLFYFILFYFILFYFILFYFILFYFILLYFILLENLML